MAARVVAVSSREATTTQTVSCDEHGILRFVLNDDPKVEQLAGLAADSHGSRPAPMRPFGKIHRPRWREVTSRKTGVDSTIV